MKDTRLLRDEFDLQYAAAKKAHESGNREAAKNGYLLAAKTLLKIAKVSSPEIAQALIGRAKRMGALAERLKTPDNTPKTIDETDTKVFTPSKPSGIKFLDIAGLDAVKKVIELRVILPIKHPEKYAAYNKKSGGGVVLFGPAGTGKTMIAKAIANETGAKFYAIKGSDIVSKWVGQSEENISKLFAQIDPNELTILFIDEMDSLFLARGSDPHNDRRVNEFLQHMDGFSGRNPNLLLLGATNRPWDIDSTVLRSGRFSQKIYVPLPDAQARLFLLKKHLEKVPGGDKIDFLSLLPLTVGCSGADIEEICDRAKEEPLLKSLESDKLYDVTDENVLAVLKNFQPTVLQADVARFESYINKLRDGQ